MTFSKEQPKDGDTIMHCGHVVGSMHWFQYEKPLRFQRRDGTRGEASWFAACERCFTRHGALVVNYVRGDEIWTGNVPVIKRMES